MNNHINKIKKVLIAEDDELCYKAISFSLRSMGLDLIHALNGEQAVLLFKENEGLIDLIIMDFNMPVMNGYDASKAIKKIDPKIPIILHTASIFMEEIEQLEANVFDEIEIKPTRPKKMKELVCTYLKIDD